VTNTFAGLLTPAPCGQATDVPLPSAMVKAVRDASCSVFSVTRKAVPSASGLARSSTRSAALLA
jgi:hypothetical protein